MTRTERIGMYMVLVFPFLVLCIVYTDHWNRVKEMNEVIPACHSGKDDCTLSMEYGIPHISMKHHEAAR